MSERNPDSEQVLEDSVAVTALRLIAAGDWNVGRSERAITVEQYATEALAAAHFTAETWRSKYLALLADLDAARRARG